MTWCGAWGFLGEIVERIPRQLHWYKHFGMSPRRSSGLATQSLQRCTETLRRLSTPGTSDVDPKYRRSLAPREGKPSGVSAEEQVEPTPRTLEGPVQLGKSLLSLADLGVCVSFAPWRMVAPDPCYDRGTRSVFFCLKNVFEWRGLLLSPKSSKFHLFLFCTIFRCIVLTHRVRTYIPYVALLFSS